MEDERAYPPNPSRAVISFNLLTNYIRQQRALSRANINDAQYQQNIDQAVARFTEVLTFTIAPNTHQNNAEQATPPTPNLPFSPDEVIQFMYSLHRIDICNLTEDNKDCEICFQRFDEWRWSNEHPVNAGASEPFKVLEDMMPEDPLRLPCGHYFGELCLHAWIKETSEGSPTCPKCRANLRSK